MFKGLSFASWFIAVAGIIGGGYSMNSDWVLVVLVVVGVVFRFFSKWFAE
jgi:hypothetical protein